MIEIIKTPEATVNGHVSKWTALHQPVVLEVQRNDANVYLTQQVAGFVRFNLNVTVPAVVQVGQKIFYKNGTVEHTATITAISVNYIYTDWTATITLSGGFVNFVDAYKNYYLDTEILSGNTLVSLGYSRNRVDAKGIAKIGIQEWLKKNAVYQNDFNYNEINKAMVGESGKFKIRSRENYNGTSQPVSGLFGFWYWSNGNKQVLEAFGKNMAEYCPTYDNTRSPKAKFITDFEQPVYFVGYPFSLSFIYSDNLLNYQIIRHEQQLDYVGSLVDDSDTNVNYTQRFAVNRLMVAGTYDSEVTHLKVRLETGSVLTIGDVDGGTWSTGVFSPPEILEVL